MDILLPCCAALDVHQKSVMATVGRADAAGRVRQQSRAFGTMTSDILRLADWLAREEVHVVAMESTGVYWKPIFNLLEDRFEIMLVNPRDVKQVPGRKRDLTDSQWLQRLLACGLLRKSFIPPRAFRQLRDLTRTRAQLIGEQTRLVNRLHKVLQDANIKLTSVASDIQGVSATAMIERLIAGETDPAPLAELARGRMRPKRPQLREALQGRVTDHHRFLLRLLTEQIRQLETAIGELDARIESVFAPFAEDRRRLTTIPGIQHRTAEAILAEVGVDMNVFPTAKNLARWAGMAPGNNESAGKRKSGRTTKGNVWLRRALNQAAWAASRARDTYPSALYHRLVGRRGRKRAIVAVGHSILVSVHAMLRNQCDYLDLGGDYFDKLDPDRLTHYLVRRLERLGHTVVLNPEAAA